MINERKGASASTRNNTINHAIGSTGGADLKKGAPKKNSDPKILPQAVSGNEGEEKRNHHRRWWKNHGFTH